MYTGIFIVIALFVITDQIHHDWIAWSPYVFLTCVALLLSFSFFPWYRKVTVNGLEADEFTIFRVFRRGHFHIYAMKDELWITGIFSNKNFPYKKIRSVKGTYVFPWPSGITLTPSDQPPITFAFPNHKDREKFLSILSEKNIEIES